MHSRTSCFLLAANDILKDSEPGSFIIRDSQSFPGAFGLAVKVAVPPAHVLQGLQGDLSKLKTSNFLSTCIFPSCFECSPYLCDSVAPRTPIGHLIVTSLGPINWLRLASYSCSSTGP